MSRARGVIRKRIIPAVEETGRMCYTRYIMKVKCICPEA